MYKALITLFSFFLLSACSQLSNSPSDADVPYIEVTPSVEVDEVVSLEDSNSSADLDLEEAVVEFVTPQIDELTGYRSCGAGESPCSEGQFCTLVPWSGNSRIAWCAPVGVCNSNECDEGEECLISETVPAIISCVVPEYEIIDIDPEEGIIDPPPEPDEDEPEFVEDDENVDVVPNESLN